MYANVKSLRSTPETNRILYINFISTKKGTEKNKQNIPQKTQMRPLFLGLECDTFCADVTRQVSSNSSLCSTELNSVHTVYSVLTVDIAVIT